MYHNRISTNEEGMELSQHVNPAFLDAKESFGVVNASGHASGQATGQPIGQASGQAPGNTHGHMDRGNAMSIGDSDYMQLAQNM